MGLHAFRHHPWRRSPAIRHQAGHRRGNISSTLGAGQDGHQDCLAGGGGARGFCLIFRRPEPGRAAVRGGAIGAGDPERGPAARGAGPDGTGATARPMAAPGGLRVRRDHTFQPGQPLPDLPQNWSRGLRQWLRVAGLSAGGFRGAAWLADRPAAARCRCRWPVHARPSVHHRDLYRVPGGRLGGRVARDAGNLPSGIRVRAGRLSPRAAPARVAMGPRLPGRRQCLSAGPHGSRHVAAGPGCTGRPSDGGPGGRRRRAPARAAASVRSG